MSHATAPQSRKHLPDHVIRFIAGDEAESLSAQEILGWSLKNFHPNMALACSFGAPEGLAVLDMMHRIEPRSRVFVLDTGRLPQATYDLIDRFRDRYDKPIEVVFPSTEAVQDLVRSRGLNLFYESVAQRELCCRVRKVEPLNRHLAGLDAWVTGLRRDQTQTRTGARKVEIDSAHGGIVKVNPIADWTPADVQGYIRSNGVPTHRLHAEGYPSVGCDPCTRAVAPGDDPRSGRWWWEQGGNQECGIHLVQEEQGSGI